MNQKERNLEILRRLKENYPEIEIKLEFNTPFQLLVATILSAQCTDDRVNIVTKDLFRKFKSPEDFLLAPLEELEKDIFSTGFYKHKAKNIKESSKILVENYGCIVPTTMEELIKLPGVGRKTASVLLGNAFKTPAIAVDTHVKRLSNLFGMVKSEDPEKIESELKEIIPQEDWIDMSHRIGKLGRLLCIARRPKCENCFLSDICPSSKKII